MDSLRHEDSETRPSIRGRQSVSMDVGDGGSFVFSVIGSVMDVLRVEEP